MSAGWQVIVYGLAFAAFVLAVIVDLIHKPYWATFVAFGLAMLALVALWNANAVFE